MSLYRMTGGDDDHEHVGMAPRPAHTAAKFTVRVVDDIQWHDWLPGCHVDLDDARAVFATSLAMADGGPVHIITDLRRIAGISREARAYFNTEGSGMTVAMLVDSPLSRVIANFFIALSSGHTELKAFTDPGAAVKWHQRKSQPSN